MDQQAETYLNQAASQLAEATVSGLNQLATPTLRAAALKEIISRVDPSVQQTVMIAVAKARRQGASEQEAIRASLTKLYADAVRRSTGLSGLGATAAQTFSMINEGINSLSQAASAGINAWGQIQTMQAQQNAASAAARQAAADALAQQQAATALAQQRAAQAEAQARAQAAQAAAARAAASSATQVPFTGQALVAAPETDEVPQILGMPWYIPAAAGAIAVYLVVSRKR